MMIIWGLFSPNIIAPTVLKPTWRAHCLFNTFLQSRILSRLFQGICFCALLAAFLPRFWTMQEKVVHLRLKSMLWHKSTRRHNALKSPLETVKHHKSEGDCYNQKVHDSSSCIRGVFYFSSNAYFLQEFGNSISACQQENGFIAHSGLASFLIPFKKKKKKEKAQHTHTLTHTLSYTHILTPMPLYLYV